MFMAKLPATTFVGVIFFILGILLSNIIIIFSIACLSCLLLLLHLLLLFVSR